MRVAREILLKFVNPTYTEHTRGVPEVRAFGYIQDDFGQSCLTFCIMHLHLTNSQYHDELILPINKCTAYVFIGVPSKHEFWTQNSCYLSYVSLKLYMLFYS